MTNPLIRHAADQLADAATTYFHGGGEHHPLADELRAYRAATTDTPLSWPVLLADLADLRDRARQAAASPGTVDLARLADNLDETVVDLRAATTDDGDEFPDQCRYCPHDADRDEAGYLVCGECGWTDNPEKIAALHETIDRLRDDLAQARATPPVDGQPRWRTGRRVGRTLYQQTGDHPADTDQLIGVLDTPELAARAVAAVNRPSPGSEAGTYDHIVAEINRSWPHWSTLHNRTTRADAIDYAVHLTLSMLQQEADRR